MSVDRGCSILSLGTRIKKGPIRRTVAYCIGFVVDINLPDSALTISPGFDNGDA
jgi:hypothetical protein